MVEREPPLAPTLRQRLDAWLRLAELLERPVSATARRARGGSPAAGAGVAEIRPTNGCGCSPADAGDGLAAAAALAADPGGAARRPCRGLRRLGTAQSPAGAGDCWVTDRLEYRFAVGAARPAGELVLAAPEYLGGRLDWYDLDVDADPAHALGAAAAEPASRPCASAADARHASPACRPSGSGSSRTRRSILGAVSAAAEDLGRLLTVEFATVFGNDWWPVPVRPHFGSLVGVRSLVVRDTFGENVLIEPTRTAARRGHRAVAHVPAERRRARPPGSGAPATPPPCARRRRRAGRRCDRGASPAARRDGEPRLGGRACRRRRRRAAARPAAEYAARLGCRRPAGARIPAELIYMLQTMVPEHWIPLVARSRSGGAQARRDRAAARVAADAGRRREADHRPGRSPRARREPVVSSTRRRFRGAACAFPGCLQSRWPRYCDGSRFFGLLAGRGGEAERRLRRDRWSPGPEQARAGGNRPNFRRADLHGARLRASVLRPDRCAAALSHCQIEHVTNLLARQAHAAATTSRHVCIADARKARCVLAEVRWRWTLKVL